MVRTFFKAILLTEEIRLRKISRIGAGIFDIYLLHLQATIFCKSRDFSYFQQDLKKHFTFCSPAEMGRYSS